MLFAFLGVLIGQKFLTAKIAKKIRKGREENQNPFGCLFGCSDLAYLYGLAVRSARNFGLLSG